MEHDQIVVKTRKNRWWIPLALVLLLAVGLLIWKLLPAANPEPQAAADRPAETETQPASANWHTGEANGTTYYVLDGEYAGDFHLQEVFFYTEDPGWDVEGVVGIPCEDFVENVPQDFSLQTVLSAAEYAEYCAKWGLTPVDTDPDKVYAVVSGADPFSTSVTVQLADVRTEGETVTVYLRDRFGGGGPITWGFVLTVPVDPSVHKLKLQPVCSAKEFENLQKYGVMQDPGETAVPEKPVIYLYPETETAVRVRLDYDGELTCTYPAYETGWTVTAAPDGTLTDAAGKIYSYLYWEGRGEADYDFSRGFCVRGEDTAAFLEQALEKLGLNRREANEFIVYWLPRMQNKPWNLIAFQSRAYTESARLEIEPAPDSLIRVFMAWKALDAPVEIQAQILSAPARTGFTVVEWGGAELK